MLKIHGEFIEHNNLSIIALLKKSDENYLYETFLSNTIITMVMLKNNNYTLAILFTFSTFRNNEIYKKKTILDNA